MKNPKYRFYT